MSKFGHNPETMFKLNAFHTISVTGVFFSLLSHLILWLVDKDVPNFWYLYPSWVAIFLFGYLWNVIDKGEDGHHH